MISSSEKRAGSGFRATLQSKFFEDLRHLVKQHLIIKSFSLLAVTYAMRRLGPSGLGELGYAMAAISVALLLSHLGLDQLLPKKMAAETSPLKRQKIGLDAYSMRLALVLCLSPMFLGGAIFQVWKTANASSPITIAFIWIAAYLLLWGTALNPEAYQQGKDEVKCLADFQLRSAVVTSVFFVGVFYFFPSSPAYLLIQAVGVLYIAWLAFARSKNSGRIWPRIRIFGQIPSYVRTYWPTIANVGVIWCFLGLDVFFLALLAPAEQVGLYAAASTLCNGVNVFVALIPMALYPRVLAWTKVSPVLAATRTIKICSAVLLAVPIVYVVSRVVCRFGVPLVLGVEYQDSAPALAALISQFFVFVGYYALTFLFVAIGEYRQVLAVSSAGAILSLFVYPLAADMGGAIYLAHGKLAVCWVMVAVGAGLAMRLKHQLACR
jgi:O-antigen/teichoic acid export membrane protein